MMKAPMKIKNASLLVVAFTFGLIANLSFGQTQVFPVSNQGSSSVTSTKSVTSAVSVAPVDVATLPNQELSKKTPRFVNSFAVTEIGYDETSVSRIFNTNTSPDDAGNQANSINSTIETVTKITDFKGLANSIRRDLISSGYTVLETNASAGSYNNLAEALEKIDTGSYGMPAFLLVGQITEVSPISTESNLNGDAKLYKRGIALTADFKLIDTDTKELRAAFTSYATSVESQLNTKLTYSTYLTNRAKITKDLGDALASDVLKNLSNLAIVANNESPAVLGNPKMLPYTDTNVKRYK
jgi:hypothetical protein